MRAFLAGILLAVAAAVVAHATERGPVTNLPLPRYVSMEASKGYARHGPGRTHRIDWVYQHRGQPLQITGEYGHWRRIRDQDGAGGWMHYSLLSGTRTVLVQRDMLAMRRKPRPDAAVMANAELGAIGQLGDCIPDWCEISANGLSGWVPKSALWGVDPDELRD